MDRLASVLLARTGRIHVPPGDADPDGFVDHLEIDLAERGWVLDSAARSRFAALAEPRRSAWAGWLLATLDAEVGSDRPHVPLFRRFPDSIPGSTGNLYVERVIAFLLQEPDQPCILCGRENTVAPVSPCGHLVCRACFDGTDYSACPVCHQRIDTDDPFLAVTASRWRKPPSAPLRMRRVLGRDDRRADAIELRDDLVRRSTPLSPADRDDLAMLIIATTAPGDLSWLPVDVPTREALATVLAVALQTDLKVAIPQAVDTWTTATDVARTLWTFAGGDPGLVLSARRGARHSTERLRPEHEPAVVVEASRLGPIPRSLRSAALKALGALDLRNAIEDILRHRTVWKRLGERLHPFEHADRHPQAAVCFAVLRGSTHQVASPVGIAILAAHEAGAVEAVRTGESVRARPKTFASLVEARFADGDARGATQLLSTRPGDFLRRLDHLARLTSPEDMAALAERAAAAAAVAAPAVALAAYATLSARDEPPPAIAIPAEVAAAHAPAVAGLLARLRSRFSDHESARPSSGAAHRSPRNEGRVPGMPRRVFFPRGNVMRAWSAADRRALLWHGSPSLIRLAIADALLGRAAHLSRFDVAVIDAATADYPLPTRARTVSPSSRTLPRGARVALPPADTLRLFLHWTEAKVRTRVDLDLSVLFLDDRWQYVGHCDYTALRFRASAVHSGDLTSAPPPLGATEFLDLRLSDLVADGVAHAVPVVFSYNDVPFDTLTDAFTGFSLPTTDGDLFEAARVVLRLDLVGTARVLVPMVIHLRERTFRWADLNISSAGYGHGIQRYSTVLGNVAEDLELAFGAGRRPSLLELAAVHAAARASHVWLRYPDGTAREVEPTFRAILDAATLTAGEGRLPDLHGSTVLFVAADRLPDDVLSAGSGSRLITGTTGDPASTADIADLVSEL